MPATPHRSRLVRLLMLTGLSCAVPLQAQDALGRTRVVVTRREARVIFPADSAREWGWPARSSPNASARYAWGVAVDAPEPRALWLALGHADSTERRFRSLAALVASADVAFCEPGMARRCRDTLVAASVEGRSVILSLRDSATVAALFGLRPAWVHVWRSTPTASSGHGDTVRVEYVEPRLPEPTVEQVAAGVRTRRRHEEKISSVTRSLDGGTQHRGTLWLAVGDSVHVSVRATSCTYDACMGGMPAEGGAERWTIGDTTIVRHVTREPEDLGESMVSVSIVGSGIHLAARRTGRTTIRVDGLPPDDSPSRTPIPRSLEREIVVTDPIRSVELLPLPDTIQVGETLEVRARAIDVRGRPIEGAPVFVRILGGSYVMTGDAVEVVRHRMSEPGIRTVIAAFGSRTDTASVVVVPARP